MKIFIKSLILTFFLAAASSQVKAQDYAYIQIAHNVADSTLDTLDLYINGVVLDSNVVYHSATGMFSYRTDTSLSIGIAYKHSDGNPTFITTDTFNAFGNSSEYHRYVFIISGVNGSNFAPNPDGLHDSIRIIEIADVDSAVDDTTNLVMRFFQGVTDLPTVDIKELYSGIQYFDNVAYGDTAQVDSFRFRHTVYEFQVTSHDSSLNYGTFYADLSGLAGQSVIMLSSGFYNQQANDSGPAFGLFVLEQSGAVLTLPLETAGFQLLHNSADTSIDSVDVYINKLPIFKSLAFRNATPAFLFNAHSASYIDIAHKNSSSPSQAFWSDTITFPRDTFFVATISGLLNPAGYASNPQGVSTAFQVLLRVPAEFTASAQSNFDFFMINGVTDAPPLNLVPTGGPLLLSNVEYAEQTNYVSLPSEFYTMNVQDTAGNTLVSGFANFLSFPGQSGVLLTSGFLYPDSNNNGPAMGLYMVPITGGPFIPLFNATGVNDISTNVALHIFPNPAANQLHIEFTLPGAETVSLQLTDINGNVVIRVLNSTVLSGTQNITADLSNLSEGMYFSRLTTSSGTVNSRFAVVR